MTGFSIKPTRRWGWFDQNESDIDVAVTDRELFDNLWQEAHEFMRKNGYWRTELEFKAYLFDGWIRPDLLPNRLRNRLFDFVLKIEKARTFGNLKVRAAFYSTDYFLEAYQTRAIDGCKQV